MASHSKPDQNPQQNMSEPKQTRPLNAAQPRPGASPQATDTPSPSEAINAELPLADDKLAAVDTRTDIPQLKQIEESPQQNKHYYRELFAHSMDGVLLTQPSGEILYANPAACALLGYTEAELQTGGRTLVIDPNDPRLPALLAERQRSGQVQGELTMIRRNGTKFEAEISSAIFASSGGQTQTSLFIRDITARKQAEEALRESEKHFKQLFKSFPLASFIWKINDNGVFFLFDINHRADAVTQNKAHQFIGRTVDEIYPDRPDIVADLTNCFQEKSVFTRENFYTVRSTGDEEYLIFTFVFVEPDMVMLHTENVSDRKKAEEARRQSEGLYASLVNSLTQNLYRIDLEGRITFANQSLIKNLGVPEAEILGKTAYDFYPTELAQKYRRDDQEIITSGKPLRLIEENINQATGERVFVDVLKIPVFADDGRVVGIQGVFEDVTVRQRAEESLRESEEKHRMLVQNINAGIVVHAPDTHILLVNEPACTLMGLTRDQMMGKTAIDPAWRFIRDDGSEMPVDDYPVNLVLSKRARLSEYVVGINRPSTNDVVWVLVNAFPDMDENGKIRQVIVTFVDITELKQAEKALRESEKLLRKIAENYPNSFLSIIERDFTIGFTSGQEFTHQGLDPGHFVGLTLEHVFGDKAAIVREHYEKTFQGEELSFELFFRNQDQLYRTVPLYAEDGTIPRILAVVENITARKQAEEELLQARKLESVGVLAGGIAHDFNNLMTALSGQIELAQFTLDPNHPARQHLEYAGYVRERAVALTRQLLTFAKGSAPIKEMQDMGQLLTEAATFAMHGSNSRLNLSIAPDLWLAEVDKGQINQVISNLIINARQAMPGGGVVTVSAGNVESDGQPNIEITIQDEGVGIDPEDLTKIFDPYFSTKSENSGLGLTTVHAIVTKHNGQISASSQVQQGTTFTLLLPANPRAKLSRPFAPDEETAAAQAGSARILVLDDDEALRLLIQQVMSFMGHQVTLTEDGQAAITAYQTAMRQGNRYHAAILDLTIPGGVTGHEAAQKILDIDPEARLVVSSGYATNPIMANYSDYGFVARLPKPYSLASLQQVLQKVLAD